MQQPSTWEDTYQRLREDNANRTLTPDKLEDLALAAYLTGRDPESFQILEDAYHSHLHAGNSVKAARCAFWLGFILMTFGERVKSSGWMTRGERTFDETKRDGPERGLFLIPLALQALYSRNATEAQHLFEQVAAIGDRFADADVITIGRLGLGQALIEQGHITSGIKLIDETMLTVEGEQVYPIVKGTVYCAAIETCRKIWDLRRAREWTTMLNRWCEAHPDMVPFRGQCLVRRAEIIQLHGELPKALEETDHACQLLIRPPGEPAAGEAYYRKAELQRMLGNFDAAEASYNEAAKWRRTPQPGLALLRLSQGQSSTAATSIRNILQETKDVKKRADLLPAAVTVLLAAGQTKEAIEASEELRSIANTFDVPYLRAMSAHCHGATLLAQGNFREATQQLQAALDLWASLDLPYESAQSLELKGLTYRQLNDNDNADAALAAARWSYEQLETAADLKRVERLLQEKEKQNLNHGLTLRELQVLRHVALGKTNKALANELFISERTVDRHVSNIFNKLGVTSRVEATAFAIRHRMVDS